MTFITRRRCRGSRHIGPGQCEQDARKRCAGLCSHTTQPRISWGVYVEIEDGELPAFLTTRNIAAGSRDRLVLLVQTQRDGTYAIAGEGLDLDE